jgi:hypothetical protein
MNRATEIARHIPRISLTPEEAAASTGFSRTRIFEAIRSGKLVARGDGKATVVETVELARWVGSLPVKGPQAGVSTTHRAAIVPSVKRRAVAAPRPPAHA